MLLPTTATHLGNTYNLTSQEAKESRDLVSQLYTVYHFSNVVKMRVFVSENKRSRIIRRHKPYPSSEVVVRVKVFNLLINSVVINHLIGLGDCLTVSDWIIINSLDSKAKNWSPSISYFNNWKRTVLQRVF